MKRTLGLPAAIAGDDGAAKTTTAVTNAARDNSFCIIIEWYRRSGGAVDEGFALLGRFLLRLRRPATVLRGFPQRLDLLGVPRLPRVGQLLQLLRLLGGQVVLFADVAGEVDQARLVVVDA